MEYTVIIVAAGQGSRMNLGYNKAYYKLDDRTILEHTMSVFLQDQDCKHLVIVTDSDLYQKEIHINDERIDVVSGGATRQESVHCGLKLVTTEYVMVHDGARPYLSKKSLEDVKAGVQQYQAVCLGVPCKDTIKVTEDGKIVDTPRRSTLYMAQTPQAFSTDLFKKCMKLASEEGYLGTDDSSLVERFSSKPVYLVEGSYENIKITTIEDLH